MIVKNECIEGVRVGGKYRMDGFNRPNQRDIYTTSQMYLTMVDELKSYLQTARQKQLCFSECLQNVNNHQNHFWFYFHFLYINT